MTKFTFVRDGHIVVTLNQGGKDLSVILAKGKSYELPEENKYIRNLVARKWLVPVTNETETPVKEEPKVEKPKTGASKKAADKKAEAEKAEPTDTQITNEKTT